MQISFQTSVLLRRFQQKGKPSNNLIQRKKQISIIHLSETLGHPTHNQVDTEHDPEPICWLCPEVNGSKHVSPAVWTYLSRMEVLKGNFHDKTRPEEMQNEEQHEQSIEYVVGREHGVGNLRGIHVGAVNKHRCVS